MSRSLGDYPALLGPSGKLLSDWIEENIPNLWNKAIDQITDVTNTGDAYIGLVADLTALPDFKPFFFAPHIDSLDNPELQLRNSGGETFGFFPLLHIDEAPILAGELTQDVIYTILKTPAGYVVQNPEGAAAAGLANKADKATTITGGGLATGGGALSASRVITVTEASTAEAQAGTNSITALSPRRGTDLFNARQADQAAAEGGSNNTAWMSALRTKQQIDERLASQSEAETATDNVKLLTALRAKQQIDARLATQGQAEAATNNTTLMTALRTAQFLTANLNWSKVSSTDSYVGDSVDGMLFKSSVISAGLHRSVWIPRQNNCVLAMDWTPSGAAPAPVGGRLAWGEWCTTDFTGAASGNPFTTFRAAATEDGADVGTFLFNGHTGGTSIDFFVDALQVGNWRADGRLYSKGGMDSGQFNIADDAVQIINVPGTAASKWALLTIMRDSASIPTPTGILVIKAGSSPINPVWIAYRNPSGTAPNPAQVDLTTGVLTGTTGTDTNITISTHTDGNLYIENRASGSIRISVGFHTNS